MIAISSQPRPSSAHPAISHTHAARESDQPRPLPRTSQPTSARPVTDTSSRSTALLSILPGKDTSSSSGRVFAKPSKEWVLPERNKPGRKVNEDDLEDKRQAQNRQSQRAHRARRTDYIQTLEERLKKFEANEIHSNVRLQEVARALKADNEKLKKEVAALRLMVEGALGWPQEKADLQEVMRSMQKEMNRLRTARGMPIIVVEQRQRTFASQPTAVSPAARLGGQVPTTETLALPQPTGRSALECPICPDPDPDCPCQQPQNRGEKQVTSMDTLTLAAQTLAHDGGSCGLCASSDDCLCRVVEKTGGQETETKCGLCTSSTFCACHDKQDTVMPSPLTSQAAIPLRLRPRAEPALTRVWSIDSSASHSQAKEAMCSGDPSNCDACREDAFGREFCATLLERTATRCPGCPGDCMPDPSFTAAQAPSDSASVNPKYSAESGTMRPDQVWRSFKHHPNASNASLSFLAEIIAKRARCADSRVERGPETTSLTPPRKRTLQIETSAVRDVLMILDRTTGPGTDGVKQGTGKRRREDE